MNVRRAATAALVMLGAAAAAAACGGASAPSPTGGPGELVHVFSASVAATEGNTLELSMALHNAGAAPDRLTGVTCRCDGTARLVRTTKDGSTVPVSGVALPSEHVVILGPHGTHVDIAMSESPSPGRTLTLQLSFRRSGPTTTVVAAP